MGELESEVKFYLTALFSLAMVIGWYLFWPMLVGYRNKFGLSATLIYWFVLSSIPFLFKVLPLVIVKISKAHSFTGVSEALKFIGGKRLISMAVYSLLTAPPILYFLVVRWM